MSTSLDDGPRSDGGGRGQPEAPVRAASYAPRLAVLAFSIPVFWLACGARAGAFWGLGLVFVISLFIPRALVLDDEGFRLVSLVPRGKVRWSDVDAFSTTISTTPRVGLGRVVRYAKAGRTARWWHIAGWPAQGRIEPVSALRGGERALSAEDLSDLLATRLAVARRARAGSERVD